MSTEDTTTTPPEVETGAEEQTRQKIMHILSIFPAISASMLQTGIGTSLPPKLWRPILEKLVESGEVTQTSVSSSTPHARHQVYTVYHLTSFNYDSFRNPAPLPAYTPESEERAA